ncbi:hypothetical protein E2542_SST28510 [Spatholobus suberectus]|nr:hypothetical protein E2542_SST28510 [Spatholobus suberectus]
MSRTPTSHRSKNLNSSSSLSLLHNLTHLALSPTHFVHFPHHTLRSVSSFSKLMVAEMEYANWDLEAAVKFIHPNTVFTKPTH